MAEKKPLTPEQLEKKRARGRKSSKTYREKNKARLAAYAAAYYRGKGAETRKEWRRRNVEKTRQYRRDWVRRHPEKSKAACKAYRSKNGDRLRAKALRFYRENREACIDQKRAMRHAALGRVCEFCGRSDSETSFAKPDRCSGCNAQYYRRGACGRCGFPLYKKRPHKERRGSLLFCPNCETNDREARRVWITLSDAQRKLANYREAQKVHALWSLMESLDVATITRTHAMPIFEASGIVTRSADRMWKRIREWAPTLPDSMAVDGVALSPVNERETVLAITINRRKLSAFLKPVIEWLAWKGVGESRGGPRKRRSA